MKTLSVLILILSLGSIAQAENKQPKQGTAAEIKSCAEKVHAQHRRAVVSLNALLVKKFEDEKLQAKLVGNTLRVSSVFNIYNTVSEQYSVLSNVIVDHPIDGNGNINCLISDTNVKARLIE